MAGEIKPPTNRARHVKNWSINKLSLDHTNDVYWIILGGIFAERDDIKSKLDAVFAKHDESKRKAVEAQHKESSFLRAFFFRVVARRRRLRATISYRGLMISWFEDCC